MQKTGTFSFLLQIILLSPALLFLHGCSDSTSSKDIRPNILLVVSDQQHYQALGLIDNSFSTPNLDALAKESTLFTHAFVTSPQCSPSRSSLYTGYYPHRTGVLGNTGSLDASGKKIERLGDSLKTTGEYLKPAGYTTAYIGKWHLGKVGKHADGYDIRLFSTVTGGDTMPDEEKTRHALSFLKKTSTQEKKQPFALFLNYTEPHNIYQYGFFNPPKPIPALAKDMPLPTSFYLEKPAEKPRAQAIFMQADSGKYFNSQDEGIWKTYRGFYRSKVSRFDKELGKVLEALKNNGLWNNTIVMVTSDHGDMDTYHRLVFKGPFGYEHLIRVPLLIHVPRRFGGKTSQRQDAFTLNVDLLPTILDFAGLPSIVGDGGSLKSLLLGSGKQSRRQQVVSEYYNKQKWVQPLRLIRNDHYKFINHLSGINELYDLKIDPDELHNLVNDDSYAQAKEQMANALEEWIKEQSDPFYGLIATDRQGKPVAHSE
jgi:arylsulfatase A-like enzyme